MSSTREKLIVALAVVSPCIVLGGLTESIVLFSSAISIFIGLCFALGYAEHLGHWPISLTLLVAFGGMAGLWAAAYHLHDPEGPVHIVLGFPIQTMLFVWIIWPMGGLMAVLHVLTFDKHLLPHKSVERVLALKGERAND